MHENGAVHRVAGQGVAQFVADDESLFLVGHDVEHAGGQDDERSIHPDGERVDHRRLNHEQLRSFLRAENLHTIGSKIVQILELAFVDTHRGGQVHQAMLSLAQQSGQRSQHRVEALEGTKSDQGCSVRRMFPSARGDIGKLDTSTVRCVCHCVAPSLIGLFAKVSVKSPSGSFLTTVRSRIAGGTAGSVALILGGTDELGETADVLLDVGHARSIEHLGELPLREHPHTDGGRSQADDGTQRCQAQFTAGHDGDASTRSQDADELVDHLQWMWHEIQCGITAYGVECRVGVREFGRIAANVCRTRPPIVAHCASDHGLGDIEADGDTVLGQLLRQEPGDVAGAARDVQDSLWPV